MANDEAKWRAEAVRVLRALKQGRTRKELLKPREAISLCWLTDDERRELADAVGR
jgi:hypothetical protein